jgi:hypothetical protein
MSVSRGKSCEWNHIIGAVLGLRREVIYMAILFQLIFAAMGTALLVGVLIAFQ